MNNSAGYTLAELVVTIVLLGTLIAVAVPTYNKVINKAQKQANLSNMETIKNTFMQYHYVTHMNGNPHFPQEPENSLLDSTYREILLEDGRTPDQLFSGDLPYNSNENPYTYYWDDDTTESEFITKRIVIRDMDIDSPSYEKFVVGEI
jgi:type II secretory pathway pseudopilin PulG|tara:strand:+ start:419 stop:862 length:444 start_codon:yes stop_codon:yes gene_type:complete